MNTSVLPQSSKTKAQLDNYARARNDRAILERVHDPYKTRSKPPEPSVCPVCKAVFHDGRWQWVEFWPMDAHRELCEACQRARDNYPAGVVTLTGAFVGAHKPEILSLAQHHEEQENTEHPLNRIMGIEEHPDALVISTTDIHLPHRIGEAVRHAWKGELQLQYDKEGCFVRVNWTRET